MARRRGELRVLLTILSLLFFSGAGATPVGQLEGRVTDARGAPIADVLIRVRGPGAVGVYETRTTREGTYHFMELPTRELLEVTADYPGKVPVTYSGIMVRESWATRRDFKLRVHGDREVLVLQEPIVPYHGTALEGVLSTLQAGTTVLTVTGRHGDARRLSEEMTLLRPNAVVAIGSEAARLARRGIKDAPVVYTMVANPAADDLTTMNLCGLTLNGGFDDQLRVLLRLRPGTRQVVTVFDPRIMAPSVRELRALSRNKDITLLARPARNTRQLIDVLGSLDPRAYDAFFLLLDPRLIDIGAFERVRRFAAEGSQVLVVPDASLVAAGGTFSYGPGFHEMGAYAGRLVNHILSGAAEPAQIAVTFPTLRSLSVNPVEVERLGIGVPPEWVRDDIEPE